MAYADETIIFLDLGGDRYCALSRAISARLADQFRHGAPWSEDVVAALGAARVMSDGEGRAVALPEISRPISDVVTGRPDGIAFLRAAYCRRRAAALLRQTHISEVVAKRRRARGRRARPASDVIRMASLFAATRPLTAARNACLRETLALLLYLGPGGADVDWVFAVKGAPFAAHCWAQLGERVLNDSVDHARGFTPIMVV